MASRGEDVAVVGGPDRPLRGSARRKSMGDGDFKPQMIMAGVVAVCCGCLFGIAALILAVFAGRKASDGDDEGARKFGRWSFAVSILGIAVGSIIIVAIIVCISVKPRFGLPPNIYSGPVG